MLVLCKLVFQNCRYTCTTLWERLLEFIPVHKRLLLRSFFHSTLRPAAGAHSSAGSVPVASISLRSDSFLSPYDCCRLKCSLLLLTLQLQALAATVVIWISLTVAFAGLVQHGKGSVLLKFKFNYNKRFGWKWQQCILLTLQTLQTLAQKLWPLRDSFSAKSTKSSSMTSSSSQTPTAFRCSSIERPHCCPSRVISALCFFFL